jgi:hypothetical protein
MVLVVATIVVGVVCTAYLTTAAMLAILTRRELRGQALRAGVPPILHMPTVVADHPVDLVGKVDGIPSMQAVGDVLRTAGIALDLRRPQVEVMLDTRDHCP